MRYLIHNMWYLISVMISIGNPPIKIQITLTNENAVLYLENVRNSTKIEQEHEICPDQLNCKLHFTLMLKTVSLKFFLKFDIIALEIAPIIAPYTIHTGSN